MKTTGAIAAAVFCAALQSAVGAVAASSPIESAKALSEGGNYGEAIDAFSKIIDEARDRATLEKAYFERAEAWHGVAYERPGEDEPLVNALEDYTRAIRVHANNQLTRRARATVYAELGAYEEAFEELRALGRLEDATNVPFWSLVRAGGIKRVLGDYEGAISAFDQAIANYASEPVMPPNYHKAITLLKMREPERALKALDEGLRGQADYASAFEFRACANAALGRFTEALDDLKKSDALGAAFPEPQVRLMSVEHDRRVEAERRALITEAAAGRIAPTQDLLDGLCFNSWWMTHFHARRDRSALLPKP
ncbi:MAG: tetratricopeptide repeat protein [Parvularculaceae bacterium]